MITAFRLPLNFDRRADVTLLHRRLDRVDLAWRIWLEWANQREATRWLRHGLDPATGQPDWAREDLTYLVATAVAWQGEGVALMAALVEVGMYQLVPGPDGRTGVVLHEFWDYNPELHPHWVSTAAKGGAAKSARTAARAAMADARRVVDLAETQGHLIFADGQTRETRQAAVALIIRVDRACGRASRRQSEYAEDLLADAAAVLGQSAGESEIERVLTWIIGQRDRPEVPTETGIVLRRWHWYRDLAAQSPHT